MTVGEAIEWLKGSGDIVVDWINAVAVWFFDEGLFNLVSGNFLDLTLGQVAFTLFMIWAAYLNIRQLIRNIRGT